MPSNYSTSSYRQVGLICPSERVHQLVAYLKRLQFDVRALWTSEPELTIHAAAEFEIPFAATSSTKPDEVLLRKDVQLVIITGRPQLHAQIAVKALGIGKHVLCDAPVTLDAAEATNVVRAAGYYPQLLSLVGYGLRHLPVFRRARELLISPSAYIGRPIACECSVRMDRSMLFRRSSIDIGDRYCYDWRWEHSMGGGVLNLVGCHVIDIITYLTGRRATRAQGLVKCSSSSSSSGYSAGGSDQQSDQHSVGGIGKLDDIITTTTNHSSSSSFRRANADDFASFLLKFDHDFVATVTLDALSSSSAAQESSFSQRIVISGSEGRVEINNHEIRATRFDDCDDGGKNSTNYCNAANTNGIVDECSGPKEKSPSSTTTTATMYTEGFAGLLRLLADALPLCSGSSNESPGPGSGSGLSPRSGGPATPSPRSGGPGSAGPGTPSPRSGGPGSSGPGTPSPMSGLVSAVPPGSAGPDPSKGRGAGPGPGQRFGQGQGPSACPGPRLGLGLGAGPAGPRPGPGPGPGPAGPRPGSTPGSRGGRPSAQEPVAPSPPDPIAWRELAGGRLATLADFEDARYARAVIDAVRHSSERGDWVKVDVMSGGKI